MTDWADEIEDEIFANAPHESGTPWTGDIAAALRKAKADGMKECADWVEQIYGPDLANSFRETASKLSPT